MILFRSSTEARQKGRQRIAEEAAEVLRSRLEAAPSKPPVAMYTLSTRQCKLITPINKRDPENRRRLADAETVIRVRIDKLQASVKYNLRLAGIKVNCEVIPTIGSHPAGEKPRLLNCQIMVVRIDTPADPAVLIELSNPCCSSKEQPGSQPESFLKKIPPEWEVFL